MASQVAIADWDSDDEGDVSQQTNFAAQIPPPPVDRDTEVDELRQFEDSDSEPGHDDDQSHSSLASAPSSGPGEQLGSVLTPGLEEGIHRVEEYPSSGRNGVDGGETASQLVATTIPGQSDASRPPFHTQAAVTTNDEQWDSDGSVLDDDQREFGHQTEQSGMDAGIPEQESFLALGEMQPADFAHGSRDTRGLDTTADPESSPATQIAQVSSTTPLQATSRLYHQATSASLTHSSRDSTAPTGDLTSEAVHAALDSLETSVDMLTSDDTLDANKATTSTSHPTTRANRRAHDHTAASATPESDASFSRLAALDDAVRAVAAATGAGTRSPKKAEYASAPASDEAGAWEELVATFSGRIASTTPQHADCDAAEVHSSASQVASDPAVGRRYDADDAHAQIGRARAASARAAAAAREAEAARADLFKLIGQPLAWKSTSSTPVPSSPVKSSASSVKQRVRGKTATRNDKLKRHPAARIKPAGTPSGRIKRSGTTKAETTEQSREMDDSDDEGGVVPGSGWVTAEPASKKPARQHASSRIISKRRTLRKPVHRQTRPTKVAVAGVQPPAPRRTRIRSSTQRTRIHRSTQRTSKKLHSTSKPVGAAVKARALAGKIPSDQATVTTKRSIRSHSHNKTRATTRQAVRNGKLRARKSRPAAPSTQSTTNGSRAKVAIRGIVAEADAIQQEEVATVDPYPREAEHTPDAWTSVDAARALAARSAIATVRRVAELEATVRQLQAELKSRDDAMEVWKASVRQSRGDKS